MVGGEKDANRVQAAAAAGGECGGGRAPRQTGHGGQRARRQLP